MAMFAASYCSTALQALTVFFVLAVLVTDVGGRHHLCRPFSCGIFSNVSHPFRRQGDSPYCGPYELVCTDTNATIRIGSGTYYVVSINDHAPYHSFRVMDTNLGMKSSCLLPRWDYHADGHRGEELFVPYVLGWATFVNCSQEINDARYNLVRCLSTIDSFIYVLTGYNTVSARNFKPSCGYLAMTPLGGTTSIEDASYEDVVEVMRKGFPVSFPIESYSVRVKECLAESIRNKVENEVDARCARFVCL
ncbi:hypothetical protein EJB05_56061, partial [Eragrostis curvula]